MFVALVQIPGAKRSKEEAITGGKVSVPMYFGKKGLIRKYYLNGDEGGGGVYIWESREAAEAWFNDDWWPMMERRFGVRPTLTYFDNHIMIDNLAPEVFIDGEPSAQAFS